MSVATHLWSTRSKDHALYLDPAEEFQDAASILSDVASSSLDDNVLNQPNEKTESNTSHRIVTLDALLSCTEATAEERSQMEMMVDRLQRNDFHFPTNHEDFSHTKHDDVFEKKSQQPNDNNQLDSVSSLGSTSTEEQVMTVDQHRPTINAIGPWYEGIQEISYCSTSSANDDDDTSSSSSSSWLSSQGPMSSLGSAEVNDVESLSSDSDSCNTPLWTYRNTENVPLALISTKESIASYWKIEEVIKSLDFQQFPLRRNAQWTAAIDTCETQVLEDIDDDQEDEEQRWNPPEEWLPDVHHHHSSGSHPQSRPSTSKTSLVVHEEEWYVSFDELAGILERYLRSRRSSFLDLGCGTSRFGFDMVLRGYNAVHGIDPSPAKVAFQTTRRTDALASYLTFTCMPLHQLTYADSTFEGILTKAVLDFISTHSDQDDMKELLEILSELTRCLQPGGVWIYVTSQTGRVTVNEQPSTGPWWQQSVVHQFLTRHFHVVNEYAAGTPMQVGDLQAKQLVRPFLVRILRRRETTAQRLERLMQSDLDAKWMAVEVLCFERAQQLKIELVDEETRAIQEQRLMALEDSLAWSRRRNQAFTDGAVDRLQRRAQILERLQTEAERKHMHHEDQLAMVWNTRWNHAIVAHNLVQSLIMTDLIEAALVQAHMQAAVKANTDAVNKAIKELVVSMVNQALDQCSPAKQDTSPSDADANTSAPAIAVKEPIEPTAKPPQDLSIAETNEQLVLKSEEADVGIQHHKEAAARLIQQQAPPTDEEQVQLCVEQLLTAVITALDTESAKAKPTDQNDPVRPSPVDPQPPQEPPGVDDDAVLRGKARSIHHNQPDTANPDDLQPSCGDSHGDQEQTAIAFVCAMVLDAVCAQVEKNSMS